jgi:hypothetical protein
MTIQEALKSNKPFKRPHQFELTIYNPDKYNGWFYHEGEEEFGSTSLDLYFEDLIADDWEIKNDLQINSR